MRYRVGVTDPDVTKGLGPRMVNAPTPEAAHALFAALEGTSVESLAEEGLTWWFADTLPEPEEEPEYRDTAAGDDDLEPIEEQ